MSTNRWRTWAQCSRESGSPELAAKRLATLGSRLRGKQRKRDPMSVRTGLVEALLFLLREKNANSPRPKPAKDMIRERTEGGSCHSRQDHQARTPALTLTLCLNLIWRQTYTDNPKDTNN